MTRRRAILILVAAAVAFVVSVALSPVTVRAGSGPAPAGWDAGVQASPTTLTVAATGTGEVVVGVPRLAFPEIFTPALVADPGPFTRPVDTGGWAADAAGALRIVGTVGDVVLDVRAAPGSDPVVVERADDLTGGAPTWRTEVPADGTFHTVTVPSPLTRPVFQRLFLLRPFAVPGGAEVRVGTIDLGTDGGGARQLGAAVRSAAGAWLQLAVGFGLVALLTLVGAAVGGLARRRLPAPVALALGIGLVASAANLLAYLVPMTVAAAVLTAVLLPVLVVGGRRLGRTGLWAVGADLAPRLAVLLPATAVAYFPLLSRGLSFAGNYKTDLFEYTNLASFLRHHSLFAMQDMPQAQQSGLVTSGAGFIWRSIDSVSAALVSVVTGTSSVGGIVLLGIGLTVAAGVGLTALAPSWHTGPRWPLALLAANPMLLALAMEDYLSQYYFVALIPLFVVVLVRMLVPGEASGDTTGSADEPVAAPPTRRIDRLDLLVLASLSGTMIASYPYFFVVAAATGSIVLLTSRAALRRALRLAPVLAVATAAFVHLAFITIWRVGEAAQFESGLDALARNVLLPAWRPVDLVSMMGGFTSFQWRAVATGTPGLGRTSDALAWIGDSYLLGHLGPFALGLAAVVVVLLCTRPVETLRRPSSRALLGVFGGWVAFALLSWLQDRPYVTLKSSWVAAALLPCVLASLVVRPRLRVPVTVASAVLAVLWAGGTVAERMPWVLPQDGTLVRGTHVSAAADLEMVRSAALPDRVAVVRGGQPLAGSDRDRVLTAHVTAILRDRDRACDNCLGTTLPETLDCPAVAPEAVVVIGRTGADERCGLPLQERGTFVEIYGPAR